MSFGKPDITSLKEVEKFLFDQIPSYPKKFPGELGLSRTKHLMGLLGNPQEKLKVIHIAGTSGKGSTAYFMSHLLNHSGFKVGLTLSPHLVDVRERFQIDGNLLPEKKVVAYFNDFLPVFNKMRDTQFGTPTYFEIVQAVAYMIFEKEKVNYAVVETGMGGTYDATNVVKNPEKICLITKIGLDHTKILGANTHDIAEQKAGIIQKGNVVFTIDQRPKVISVFTRTCAQKQAKLFQIKREINYTNAKILEDGITFDFKFDDIVINNLFVSVYAFYQIQNVSLAFSAFIYLVKRDQIPFDVEKVREALKKSYFPGRFDKKKIKGKTLVIDGAHNPQKMRAFLDSLVKVFPGKKYNFVIAFKKGKDYKKMLLQIRPLAAKIYITSFFVQSDTKENLSMEEALIAKSLKKLGFDDTILEHNPAKCLKLALNGAGNLPTIVTGSLYLVGETYKALAETLLG